MNNLFFGVISDAAHTEERLFFVGEPINISNGSTNFEYLIVNPFTNEVEFASVDNTAGALQEFADLINKLGIFINFSGAAKVSSPAPYELITRVFQNILFVKNVPCIKLQDCNTMATTLEDFFKGINITFDSSCKYDDTSTVQGNIKYSAKKKDVEDPAIVKQKLEAYDLANGTTLVKDCYHYVNPKSVELFKKYDDDFLFIEHNILSSYDREDVYAVHIHGIPGATKTSLAEAIGADLGYPVVFFQTNPTLTVEKMFHQIVPDNNGGWIYTSCDWLRLLELNVPHIVIFDEGHVKPDEFKSIFSMITTGKLSLKTETVVFDPQCILAVFTPYNPDSAYKIESSVFSRTNLLLRNATEDEQLAYLSLDMCGDLSTRNLFVINKFPLVDFTTNIKEHFNIRNKSFKLRLSTNNFDFYMPQLLVGDSLVSFDSVNKLELDVNLSDGLNCLYIRPNLNLSLDDINILSPKELKEIRNLYLAINNFVLVENPIKDMSGITSDAMVSKIDNRHFKRFLDSIFVYQSVGYACFKFIRNLIQPDVTKFIGSQSSDYARINNWAEKADTYAIQFINKNLDLIKSLHKNLFLLSDTIISKVIEDTTTTIASLTSVSHDKEEDITVTYNTENLTEPSSGSTNTVTTDTTNTSSRRSQLRNSATSRIKSSRGGN